MYGAAIVVGRLARSHLCSRFEEKGLRSVDRGTRIPYIWAATF